MIGAHKQRRFPVDIPDEAMEVTTASDVTRFLARVASKRFADAVISPELRRTMEELHKVFALPQMVATRKKQAEIVGVANSPAMEALRRQRPR